MFPDTPAVALQLRSGQNTSRGKRQWKAFPYKWLDHTFYSSGRGLNVGHTFKAVEVVVAFLRKIVMDTNSITCLSNNIEAQLYPNMLVSGVLHLISCISEMRDIWRKW